jgi:hypothetical protein
MRWKDQHVICLCFFSDASENASLRLHYILGRKKRNCKYTKGKWESAKNSVNFIAKYVRLPGAIGKKGEDTPTSAQLMQGSCWKNPHKNRAFLS